MFKIYEAYGTTMFGSSGNISWEVIHTTETKKEADDWLLELGLCELDRNSEGLIEEGTWTLFYNSYKIEYSEGQQ